MVGIGEKMLRRADFDNCPFVHKDHPIRDFTGKSHLVGGGQSRPAYDIKVGPSYTNSLFNIFFPVSPDDPFIIKTIIETVALGLSQEIVQKVEEIRIAFVNGPCQRLIGERFIQKDRFALAPAAM